MSTDRQRRIVVKSLRGFAKDKREGCTVCALPRAIRIQLEDAPKQSIRLDDQLQWLKAGGYLEVTREHLLRHRSARH